MRIDLESILVEKLLGKPASPQMSLRNVLKSVLEATNYKVNLLFMLEHDLSTSYEIEINHRVDFTDKKFEDCKDILDELAQFFILDKEYVVYSKYEHHDEDWQIQRLIESLRG